MVSATPARSRPGIPRVARRAIGGLDELGRLTSFTWAVVRAMPLSITRYRMETLRLVGDVALGRGALAALGGSVGVVVAMSFFIPMTES